MKKLKLLLTSVLVLALLTVNAFAFSANQININGESVNLTNPIKTTEVNVFISLRELSTALGMTVEWSAEQRAISLIDGEKEYYVKPDLNVVKTNDYKTYSMSSNAYIDNGVTYVPLNMVVDVFELDLAKSEETYSISSYGDAMLTESKTVDELYNLALENSEVLKTAERNVARYEITEEDARDTLALDTPSSTGSGEQDAYRLSAYQNYFAQGIGLEMAERTVETTKEQIYHQLLSSIESIQTETDRLELVEASLEVAKITAEQNKLKFELGLISALDFDSAEISYQNVQNNLNMQKLTLENKWIDLNEMVGYETSIRHNLDYNLEFEMMVNRDLEAHIRWAINKSPSLWNLEQQIELAENSVKFYVFNAGGSAYDAEEIDVTLAKINLNQAEAALEEGLRTAFNSIATLEENQNKLQLAVSDAKNDLVLAKSNFEVGLATELQLKSAELALESAEMNLLDNIATYKSTVRLYETPWITN